MTTGESETNPSDAPDTTAEPGRRVSRRAGVAVAALAIGVGAVALGLQSNGPDQPVAAESDDSVPASIDDVLEDAGADTTLEGCRLAVLDRAGLPTPADDAEAEAAVAELGEIGEASLQECLRYIDPSPDGSDQEAAAE